MACVESRALIVDLKETTIATGSACTSVDEEPSHVITAMHDEQIDEAARWIVSATEQLRAFAL